ncbi:PREDICTED: CD226 antigen [Chrysochloris asiatica]|uniref:CD226 antigen n=1 Tax=Chrysochloris asiatica TaxID=185453 RepID=A0A9B0WKC8_CHRAS|nr:PREDICTED: CD226 antigen [Chrysochloris asiatica]
MDFLAFLFVILHVYKALCEEVFWDTTVKFAKNMTLECVYPSTDTLTQMEWFKINSTKKESIAIFNPTYGALIREPYVNRAYFSNSSMEPNDMTLSFVNASEADVGFYSCFLYTFPSGPWEKVLRVIQSDSFETTVPSNSHLVSKPGENITLTYQLRSVQPMQRVLWEKIQPHQIDILSFCNLSQGKSHMSKYQRQIQTNCSQRMRRSFIIIPHVVPSDSGLYRCYFEASTGEQETFLVRLTVTNGETDEQHILFLAGGIALLLLLATLITTIIIIYCKRCPTSTDQTSDDPKEDIYVNYPAFPRRPKLRV